MKFLPLLSFLVAGALSHSLVGCGGGGGGGGSADGGNFSGAANASIQTQPSTIDSGDRTRVSIELFDVHENGIAVKIRYPEGLTYVASSAFLFVNEKKIDVSPTINDSAPKEDLNYLVFYLGQNLFRRAGEEYTGEGGTLILQLEGRDTIRDGEIEVDPDVDDPAEDNSSEFKIDTPEFVAEDATSISVVAE